MRPRGVVLVVEDDADIRGALSDVLEDEGYRVRTASNGREALEVLTSATTPCVILLDLMMPVMSGSEFLTVLRRQQAPTAEVPVVVVSAWPKDARELRHLAQGYVPKPVEIEILLGEVTKYCEQC